MGDTHSSATALPCMERGVGPPGAAPRARAVFITIIGSFFVFKIFKSFFSLYKF